MCLRDTLNRPPDRLDNHLHLMSAGVYHPFPRLNDPDMAPPENQIAALQLVEILLLNRLAQFRLLHIRVAWAQDSSPCQAELDEAGAVYADTRTASP